MFVWYAAYGSSMHEPRFKCFIEGGRVQGCVRQYEPCMDTSPPLQVLPLRIPYQLYFAGESTAWTGGVAFVKPVPGFSSLARAYLIPLRQLQHVVCQKNQVPKLSPLPIDEAVKNGTAQIPGVSSSYDQIVYLGHRSRTPVVTITTSKPKKVNAPAAAYLIHIISGLRSMRYSHDQIISYLRSTPGASKRYSTRELKSLIEIAASPTPVG